MVTGRLRKTGSDAGFSLVELVVAAALTALVVGGAISLATPTGHVARVQPDAADMNDRLRAGVAAISRDLYAAGAGIDAGPMVGSLGRFLPAVLPRRIGEIGGEASTVARADAVTVLWVPDTDAQTTLAAPIVGGSLTVNGGPGCPIGRPACGLEQGMGAIVFDALGRFDLFTVLDAQGPIATVHRGSSAAQDHREDAIVSEVRARTYYFDRDAKQLRVYDTDLTDSPAIDDVVAFEVQYFGSPSPPAFPKPPLGESNCLYDDEGQRLPSGPVLAPGAGGQSALPLSMFADGPWCGAGDTAFDADLLRIRRVRITLGVQAATAAHRTTGRGFSTPGTSRSAWRRLADHVVTFDVTPRNLNLAQGDP